MKTEKVVQDSNSYAAGELVKDNKAAPGHIKPCHSPCKKTQGQRQCFMRPVGCWFTFPRASSRASLRHAPQAWGCTAQRYQALRVNIMWVLCAVSHRALQKAQGTAGHCSLRRIIHIMCKYRWALRPRQAAKSAFYLPRPPRSLAPAAPAAAKSAASSVPAGSSLLPSAPKGAPQKTKTGSCQRRVRVCCLPVRVAPCSTCQGQALRVLRCAAQP